MATHAGNEGIVKISTYTIAEVTGWEYNENASLVEDSELVDTVKTYKAGQKDGSGTIECHWDPTDTNAQKTLRSGASIALVLYPTGVGVGTKWSGTVPIETMKINGSRDGLVEATFTFKGVLAETAA